MSRTKITPYDLRNMILAEVEKAGLEDKPENLQFFGTEDGAGADGPSWTVSFQGPIMFSPDAQQLRAIIERLGRQFDIEWRALH